MQITCPFSALLLLSLSIMKQWLRKNPLLFCKIHWLVFVVWAKLTGNSSLEWRKRRRETTLGGGFLWGRSCLPKPFLLCLFLRGKERKNKEREWAAKDLEASDCESVNESVINPPFHYYKLVAYIQSKRNIMNMAFFFEVPKRVYYYVHL